MASERRRKSDEGGSILDVRCSHSIPPVPSEDCFCSASPRLCGKSLVIGPTLELGTWSLELSPMSPPLCASAVRFPFPHWPVVLPPLAPSHFSQKHEHPPLC